LQETVHDSAVGNFRFPFAIYRAILADQLSEQSVVHRRRLTRRGSSFQKEAEVHQEEEPAATQLPLRSAEEKGGLDQSHHLHEGLHLALPQKAYLTQDVGLEAEGE